MPKANAKPTNKRKGQNAVLILNSHAFVLHLLIRCFYSFITYAWIICQMTSFYKFLVLSGGWRVVEHQLAKDNKCIPKNKKIWTQYFCYYNPDMLVFPSESYFMLIQYTNCNFYGVLITRFDGSCCCFLYPFSWANFFFSPVNKFNKTTYGSGIKCNFITVLISYQFSKSLGAFCNPTIYNVSLSTPYVL